MHTNQTYSSPRKKVKMAMWERHTQNVCPKGPSFSSSLLDSIYRSIDETRPLSTDHRKPPLHRRNKPEDDDVESLRRAIMIEKWIDNHSSTTTTTTTTSSACRSTPRHLPSNSASSTDSSVFSSSETDSSSASKTSPKSKLKITPKKLDPPPLSEGRLSKTKTRAQKLYGDLKKAKEPISPGGKISTFFNSIFSPRNSKSDDLSSSMRKSRSMKEAATCSLVASRSCLSKNASSRGSKSKRTVRFCPVTVIVDQDEIIKRNDFRVFEGKSLRKHQVKDFYRDEKDFDDMSCASSDLFELENIGRVEYEQELPLYETTSIQISGKISW